MCIIGIFEPIIVNHGGFEYKWAGLTLINCLCYATENEINGAA